MHAPVPKRIVAIGGGDLRTLATEPIDRAIIELTGRASPNVLFVPTASSDSPEYWQAFDHAYRVEYGCRTDVLYLLGSPPPPVRIAAKVRWADVVYVGGGNTLKMMRRWRRLGVDRLLREAYAARTVLCGTSAGAICWFDRGHSDSMSFYRPDRWDYIAVTGMGLLPGLACPHYDGDTAGVPRRAHFHEMLARKGGPGLAIDNDCAVAFGGDGYRVIPAAAGAAAYALMAQRGRTERRLHSWRNEAVSPNAGCPPRTTTGPRTSCTDSPDQEPVSSNCLSASSWPLSALRIAIRISGARNRQGPRMRQSAVRVTRVAAALDASIVYS